MQHATTTTTYNWYYEFLYYVGFTLVRHLSFKLPRDIAKMWMKTFNILFWDASRWPVCLSKCLPNVKRSCQIIATQKSHQNILPIWAQKFCPNDSELIAQSGHTLWRQFFIRRHKESETRTQTDERQSFMFTIFRIPLNADFACRQTRFRCIFHDEPFSRQQRLWTASGRLQLCL